MRKNKEITKCDNNTVTCNLGTAQWEDDTIKCEKKVKELSNVTKVQSLWCWYCVMRKWYHQMWEKIRESQNVTKI